MVCIQVIAETARSPSPVRRATSSSTRWPIVIDTSHSARILGDASEKLLTYCIEGAELNRERIAELVNRSLMLVTALSPVIGYDEAAAIAHKAHVEGTTLREAAIASGAITGEAFDAAVDPKSMVGKIEI